MPTSQEIRRQFIDFFVEQCGHTEVPSSPVVPHDDPTLLFTNAGMNQFKDVFLGVGGREYSRAVDTQKCIRAGGKHNDLDDVGKDTYHHTFFEMLGNWSFGDYFKPEAIDWAWKLLVDVWGLDPKRLHATYFGGAKAEGLDPDDEAKQLWLKHLPAKQVHPGKMKDNFWEMGDTGPCGPCSEIHFDRTPDFSGAGLVNADDPRVIEIWNLVFIQFNRDASGKLASLPARHVDTGMGFERITAVLQGKASNYDTDIFTPIFAAIGEITGTRNYGGKLDDPIDIAYRVIADHIRCLTFALTDGAHCGNEGRDYVLRRILRRAVRYGRQTLGVAEPFFYRLVPTVVELMGEQFPELNRHPDVVAEELREEEESFGRTLDRGIDLFEEALKQGGKQVSAEDAFRLYDTFGFPIDLTQLMAEERGITVDMAGFEALMAEARERSRAEGGHTDAVNALVEVVRKQDLPATQFTGYDELVTDGATMVDLYVHHDNGRFDPSTQIQTGQSAALVTDRTPFYAEAGGQVGDTGAIHSRHGAVYRVTDTIKVGEVYFHLGELEAANVRRGADGLDRDDPLLLEVDQPRRQRIMAHHTATHLMNWALREVLGDHVNQQGSLVDEEKTRFDFNHHKAVSAEQIEQIEQHVKRLIAEDLAVYADYAPQEEALKIHGLRAVFGEKYPPTVRVVSIGKPAKELLKAPGDEKWREYSIEFCGGTHLGRTGEASDFAIVGEEAVAKGVRRVVAIAGPPADRARANAEYLRKQIRSLKEDDDPEMLEEGLNSITEELNEMQIPLIERQQLRESLADVQRIVKKHQKDKSKEAAGAAVDVAREIAEKADGQVIVESLAGADQKSLRSAMDVLRKKRPDAALLLISDAEGKVAMVATVPEALIERGLKAGDWVRETAQVVGGGGGGRPDMAQAGGKDPQKIDHAVQTAREFAEGKISV